MRCRLNESALGLMTDSHRRVGQGDEDSDFSLRYQYVISRSGCDSLFLYREPVRSAGQRVADGDDASPAFLTSPRPEAMAS